MESPHFKLAYNHLVSILFVEGNNQNSIDSLTVVFNILFAAEFYSSWFRIIDFKLSIFATRIIN